MRNWRETMDWYDKHQTTKQIGFNPDGMCLKVCRTARNIGSMYPTAVAAQEATPKENRFYKISDLRRGMVLYFDDPNDSNRFGHIVTMVGRVPGGRRDRLDDILVETNSVKKGELVVVRASYFKTHWGDAFKFGANWLNGQYLDVPAPVTTDKFPDNVNRVEKFWKTRENGWNLKLLEEAQTKGQRRDVSQQLGDIREAVADLPKNKSTAKFWESYDKKDVVDLRLLNQIVARNSKATAVLAVRNRIRSSIKSLPRH